MTTASNLAFIGAGNMASALIKGAITRGGRDPDTLAATDLRADAVHELVKSHRIRHFSTNAEACGWADVIVLAVKPQTLPAVLAEIRGPSTADKLVISIAAGVSIARMSELLGGHARIVRAMPNTPALVGEGATAIAAGPSASGADLDIAEELFKATGLVVRTDERLMDAVTGLSGSGPAYAFIAIEALSDAGVRAGLARDVATQLAAQTLLGAAKLVLETGDHPGKLKDMVTSPAGTTIAGVAALEAAGFRHALLSAVAAAVARSKELAG